MIVRKANSSVIAKLVNHDIHRLVRMTARDRLVLRDRRLDGSAQAVSQPHSGPTETASLERQGAKPLASSGKDGVAHRRQCRRQRRLTQARRCVVSLAPIHLNLRRLSHAHQRVVMEVGLLDLAIHQRDLLPHVAHSLDDATEGNVLGRSRVDDLAANISCSPDLVHCHPVLCRPR